MQVRVVNIDNNSVDYIIQGYVCMMSVIVITHYMKSDLGLLLGEELVVLHN